MTTVGLYKWKRLPIGLTFAPGDFQNMLELVFSGLCHEFALVFTEEITVFEKMFGKYLQHLEQVFMRLEKSCLKTKGSKCKFFEKKILFLGECCVKKSSGIGSKEAGSSRGKKTTKQLARSTSSSGFSWSL